MKPRQRLRHLRRIRKRLLSLERLDDRVLLSASPLADVEPFLDDPVSTVEQVASAEGEGTEVGVLDAGESAPLADQPSAAPEVTSVTDDLLRDYLLDTIPDLRSALANDPLGAALLLRDWAANVTNFAIDTEMAISTTSLTITNSAADLYFNVFAPGAGGVWCGGYAVFYDKVLKLFGFNSFAVDFGDVREGRGGLTHVVVIVPIQSEDGWEYYLMDPTFNASFRDGADGRVLTVFEMMDYLQQGRVADIVIENPSPDDRLWVSFDPIEGGGFVPLGKTGNTYLYAFPGYGLQTFLDGVQEGFAAYGYSPGLEGLIQLLMNHVYGVGASLDPAAAEQFVSQLVQRGVPLGYPTPPAPAAEEIEESSFLPASPDEGSEASSLSPVFPPGAPPWSVGSHQNHSFAPGPIAARAAAFLEEPPAFLLGNRTNGAPGPTAHRLPLSHLAGVQRPEVAAWLASLARELWFLEQSANERRTAARSSQHPIDNG